jgi:hypothetical protein
MLSWMVSQECIHGEDQIEESPAWICKIELSCKCCLTCKTKDQNTDLGPGVEVVQKDELG